MPTIFIVDDDADFGLALAEVLQSAGYSVKVFQTAIEFLVAHDPTCPGCLLLDVRLPALDGLQLQRILEVSGSMLPIVFLSGLGTIEMTVQALRCGAIDFLTKPIGMEHLLGVVKRAFCVDAERRSLAHKRDELRSRFATLTPREREVLGHVVQGRMNKQIAADLGTVEKTIKVHRARVMDKLKVGSLAELVQVAGEMQPNEDGWTHTAEILKRARVKIREASSDPIEEDRPDRLTVAMWDWDIVNNRVVADRNLARLFGVTEAVARGGPLAAYVARIHPEDRPRVESAIREAILTGKEFSTTYRIVHPDSHPVVVVARGRVEFDSTGRPTRFPGVLIDISSRYPHLARSGGTPDGPRSGARHLVPYPSDARRD